MSIANVGSGRDWIEFSNKGIEIIKSKAKYVHFTTYIQIHIKYFKNNTISI